MEVGGVQTDRTAISAPATITAGYGDRTDGAALSAPAIITGAYGDPMVRAGSWVREETTGRHGEGIRVCDIETLVCLNGRTFDET